MQPPATIELCQYVLGAADQLSTTLCDPFSQWALKSLVPGSSYSWKMGYAFAFQTPGSQPYGTVPLCTYTNSTYHYLTTTYCSQTQIDARYGPGWSPSNGNGGQIGWVFWTGLPKPSGATELCEYKHSSGRFLATTQCDAASQANLAQAGFTYWGVLGYVYRNDAPPPWGSPTSIQDASETVTAQVEPSSELDRVLHAQVYDAYASELPPVVFTNDNGTRLYVMPTQWTYLCIGGDNYLAKALAPWCALITQPDILDSVNSSGGWCDKQPTASRYWARTYDGMFSIHDVGTGPNRKLIGFAHGENQNVYEYQNSPCSPTTLWCKNTVKANGIADQNACTRDTCAGNWTTPAVYDAWTEFSAFASTLTASYDGVWPGTFSDMGPAVWPGTLPGYAAPPTYDQLGAVGLYHPTSFVDGTDVYLYYQNITPSILGWGCIEVARATLDANSAVGPFKAYRSGSFSALNVLPASLTFDTLGNESECMTRGPETTSVAEVYFNVAKIRNTPYYVSVEESVDYSNPPAPKTRILLRISLNPYSWKGASVTAYTLDEVGSGAACTGTGQGTCAARETCTAQVCSVSGSACTGTGQGTCPAGQTCQPRLCAGGWGSSNFTYPTFVDKGGTSNYAIDANDFYVIGNWPNGGHSLWSRRLCIALPGYSSCP